MKLPTRGAAGALDQTGQCAECKQTRPLYACSMPLGSIWDALCADCTRRAGWLPLPSDVMRSSRR